LLYARFFTRALADTGLGPKEVREPFAQLFCQGMIRLGGRAMSKSKGNVVSPDDYFAKVGADSLRLLHLFIGPPVDDVDWNEQTEEILEGCSRYLGRVWRLATDAPEQPDHPAKDNAAGDSHELKRAVHHTIARVTADIERYSFNTAVAACMELSNTISRHARSGTDRAVIEESTDTLLELLAPFAPHLAAEAYERRHGDNVHTRPWPVADVRLLTERKMTMVVQVSGKLKDRIEVERDISEKAATEMALASPRVQEALGGALPARVIAKPPRLVNIIP
jgi:leucyl-tRNA synthetase